MLSDFPKTTNWKVADVTRGDRLFLSLLYTPSFFPLMPPTTALSFSLLKSHRIKGIPCIHQNLGEDKG